MVRAALLLGLALLEAGLLLGSPGLSDPAAVPLERAGSALLSAAAPFTILMLPAYGPRGRRRLALGAIAFGSGCAAAFAASFAGAGSLPLRICIWSGFVLTLAAASFARARFPELRDQALWRRLAWVLLPGAPIFVAAQLPLMSAALAPARPWLAGLDVAWFALGLSWALSRDAVASPGRGPTAVRASAAPPAPADRPPAGPAAWKDGLSPRERELAGLLEEGLAYKEIAARLGLATKTVDHRVQALYRKAGVNNRHALVRRLGEPLA